MKKLVLVGMALVLPVVVAGCSGGADSLLKQQISIMNDIAANLETVKDDASADAAIAKLDKQVDQLTDNMKKMKELKLSPEEQKKLMEKHKTEIENAGKRMQAAMQGAVMKAPGKAMKIWSTFMKTMDALK
jgi:hypothetical protein